MIDCSKCPFLIRFLGNYDKKYGGRHWQYICGKKIFKTDKVHFIRKTTKRNCRFWHGTEQTQLWYVLGSDNYTTKYDKQTQLTKDYNFPEANQ